MWARGFSSSDWVQLQGKGHTVELTAAAATAACGGVDVWFFHTPEKETEK